MDKQLDEVGLNEVRLDEARLDEDRINLSKILLGAVSYQSNRNLVKISQKSC